MKKFYNSHSQVEQRQLSMMRGEKTSELTLFSFELLNHSPGESFVLSLGMI